MSKKQWKRLEVLEQTANGRWAMKEGSQLVGLSSRQFRRLYRRYEKKGHRCLIHGNTGRSPPNKLSQELRDKIIDLRKGRYAGFNDQHFTEKLVEVEKIPVSRPTVQRVLRMEHIASPRKRRPRKFRKRRERMAQSGMMVIWDGSKHDWLEGRGPKLCLVGALDDASGKLLEGAHFVEEECSAAYLKALRDMVHEHGVPWKAYMDMHGALRRNDGHWTLEEELAGQQEPTQVGRALAELGIEVIYAHSPQAKGRVERLWETFQDRLVSELRLAGASNQQQANTVLRRFRSDFNRRFGVAPANCCCAWRKLPKGTDLDRICSFYTTAVVRNDSSIIYQGIIIDLPPGPHKTSYAKKIVDVHHLLDGRIQVYLGDKLLATKITAPPTKSPKRPHRKIRLQAPKPDAKNRLTFKQILAKYKQPAQRAKRDFEAGLRAPPSVLLQQPTTREDIFPEQ